MTVDELPESQVETEPQAQEEEAAEEAVVVEQKRTWRPAFDTTFQDVFTYVAALLCGCFCVYVFFYSPAVGYERMLKSKVPKLEFDTAVARIRVVCPSVIPPPHFPPLLTRYLSTQHRRNLLLGGPLPPDWSCSVLLPL